MTSRRGPALTALQRLILAEVRASDMPLSAGTVAAKLKKGGHATTKEQINKALYAGENAFFLRVPDSVPPVWLPAALKTEALVRVGGLGEIALTLDPDAQPAQIAAALAAFGTLMPQGGARRVACDWPSAELSAAVQLAGFELTADQPGLDDAAPEAALNQIG